MLSLLKQFRKCLYIRRVKVVLRDTVFYGFQFKLYWVTRYFTDFRINCAQNRKSLQQDPVLYK